MSLKVKLSTLEPMGGFFSLASISRAVSRIARDPNKNWIFINRRRKLIVRATRANGPAGGTEPEERQIRPRARWPPCETELKAATEPARAATRESRPANRVAT